MVSIVVPVYNCIATLERCVQSILNQTLDDWELLLIDDGSTDGSGLLCDRLAAKQAEIRVFHKSNGGVSSARNFGLDHIRGEFVAFCDSDDWVEPEWCETLYRALSEEPNSLPICNYYRNTPMCQTINRAETETCIAKEEFWGLNGQELLGIPWNKLFRRQIIEEHHIRFRTDISLGEDLCFTLDYIHHFSGGFYFVNIPLYHYSLGNTDSLSAKYYADLAAIYQIVYGRVREELLYIPGAWETWEMEYRKSYFFAFDRVFRNTWSKKNTAAMIQKWRYNSAVFHSNEFQACRRMILNGRINALQNLGLRSNSFVLYWLSVVVSEWISSHRHRQ